jgi:hypothetical protein
MNQPARFHIGQPTPQPFPAPATITVRIPRELYNTLLQTVDDSGTTLDHVVTSALQIAFTTPAELGDL